MADKMMRIAGRTPSGTAVPMLADANGNIGTIRKWKKEWASIETSVEIRDTNAHNCPAVDVSDVPIFSLRFLNRLDVPVTVSFLTDVNTTNGYGIQNANGERYTITLAPQNGYIIITPEDMPILNYLRYVRLQVKASSAPSSGVFDAYIVTVK